MTALDTQFSLAGYISDLEADIRKYEEAAWEEVKRQREIIGLERLEEFELTRRFILSKCECEVYHMRMEVASIRRKMLDMSLVQPFTFTLPRTPQG